MLLRQAQDKQNGTTSNEEIPTAKYPDVTLHKRISLISSYGNILNISIF